jgi:hypothetical protein
MARTLVEIQGCDDTTVFWIDLTPAERRVVERLIARTDVLGGGCRPKIVVPAVPDKGQIEEADEASERLIEAGGVR